MALSSCEAEIFAASEATKEGIYLTGLAREVGLRGGDPVDLKMDNKSSIDVAYNPEHFGRMKRVDRRRFFVRECVENRRFRVPFVRTDGRPGGLLLLRLCLPVSSLVCGTSS